MKKKKVLTTILIATLVSINITTQVYAQSHRLPPRFFTMLMQEEGKWGLYRLSIQKTEEQKRQYQEQQRQIGQGIQVSQYTVNQFKEYPVTELQITDPENNFTIGYRTKEGKNIKISDRFENPQKVISDRVSIAVRDLEKTIPGIEIEWNQENKLVLIKRGEIELVYPLNKQVMARNENIEPIDVSATIETSTERTYLPLRDIVEKLGFDVEYTDAQKLIMVIEK